MAAPRETFIRGNESVNVAGESHYQEALRAIAGQAPPMKEGTTVDALVGLVVDGLASGKRELRYDLQKGELVVR